MSDKQKSNFWDSEDKLGTRIKLVASGLALIAGIYAVKPLVYDLFGLSRVSEIRNAQVVHSLESGKGKYTVEVRKLRGECPITSLQIGAVINNRPYNVKLERGPYQLSGNGGWVTLEFDATIVGATAAGRGLLNGVAQYQCPEGLVSVLFPINSKAEIVD